MTTFLRTAFSLLALISLSACGGGGGSDGASNTPPPAADTTPPDTSLDEFPQGGIASSVASFEFSATETGATFEYSLDGGAWVITTNPLLLSGFTAGPHSFAVRARDAAGNVDQSPPSVQWLVVFPEPETFVVAQPPEASRADSADFEFLSSDPTATFEASLDLAPYAAAANPLSLTDLAPGRHLLMVRARADGLVDSSPAMISWVVDHIPPSARIVFPPNNSSTDATQMVVRGNANDAHGVAAVSVNGFPASTTDGYQTWEVNVPLVFGHNPLTVRATDVSGNVAAAAASTDVIHHGPTLGLVRGLEYDPLGNRLVFADQNSNILYSMRRADDLPEVLSPSPTPQNYLYGITDLAIDAANSRVLVLETYANTVVTVNLTTGARTTLVAADGGAATKFRADSRIALDGPGTHLYVASASTRTILEVDLATGTRRVLASNSVGGGHPLGSIASIAFEDAPVVGPPRLLLVQGSMGTGSLPEILAVELATGDRTDAFPPNTVPGLGLYTPVDLYVDAPSGHVLVLDRGRLLTVDTTTGGLAQLPAGALAQGRFLAVAPGAPYAYTAGANEIFELDYGNQRMSTLLSSRTGEGLDVNYPQGMVIEQSVGGAASLLVVDPGYPRLMRVNVTNGLRTAVSDDFGIGSGPQIIDARDLALDTRAGHEGQALVMIGSHFGNQTAQIVAVDLATGIRTHVVDIDGATSTLLDPKSLRLDATNNRVLFTDGDFAGHYGLYAVDLATGVRTTVASPTQGTGPGPEIILNLALEGPNPRRAFVTEFRYGGIYSVDLISGDRSLFLDPFPGEQSAGDNVTTGLHFDAQRSRLLGVRSGTVNNLFSVNLADGSQTVLSGAQPSASLGHGPELYGCFSLDVSSDDVAFLACPWMSTIMAVDTMTGERVIVAR